MALHKVVSKPEEELVLTRGSVGVHGERILMFQEEETVLKRGVGKDPTRRSSGLRRWRHRMSRLVLRLAIPLNMLNMLGLVTSRCATYFNSAQQRVTDNSRRTVGIGTFTMAEKPSVGSPMASPHHHGDGSRLHD